MRDALSPASARRPARIRHGSGLWLLALVSWAFFPLMAIGAYSAGCLAFGFYDELASLGTFLRANSLLIAWWLGILSAASATAAVFVVNGTR